MAPAIQVQGEAFIPVGAADCIRVPAVVFTPVPAVVFTPAPVVACIQDQAGVYILVPVADCIRVPVVASIQVLQQAMVIEVLGVLALLAYWVRDG